MRAVMNEVGNRVSGGSERPGLINWLSRYFAGQKFLLLNGLAVFLCFVLLPGVIIFLGADASVSQYVARQSSKARHELESRLDQLEFFASGDQFAHSLLFMLCRNDAGDLQNLSALQPALNRLRKKFPGAFSFVVADHSGRVIGNLSDLGGFNYFYRQAFSLIGDASDAAARNLDSGAVNDLEVRLNRLRPFLGDLFRSEDLLMPFRGRRAGRSILVSGSFSKYHLWYGVGSDFRLLCFINRDFIRGKAGLVYASSMLNKLYPDTVTGFAPFPPEEKNLIPDLSGKAAADTILALARSEGPFFAGGHEIGKAPILCRFIHQNWRGFSFFKNNPVPGAREIRMKMLALLLRVLLISGFVLSVYQLKRPIALTVKLKIFAFFAYSICLPLLVIASLTMQYIVQSEASLINGLRSDSQRVIEKIDHDYEWYLKKQAKNLSSYFRQTIENDPSILADKSALKKFDQGLYEAVCHDEVIILDPLGNDLLQGTGTRVSRNRGLLKSIGADALKISLSEHVSEVRNKFQILALHLAVDLYHKQNCISYLGVGDYELGVFYLLLRPVGYDVGKTLFATVLWQLENLHRHYIVSSFQNKSSRPVDRQLAVLDIQDDRFVVAPEKAGSGLMRFMKLSLNRHSNQSDLLRVNGRDYIAVAIPGKNLNKLILAALVPAEIVKRHSATIIFRAQIFAVLLVLVMMATFFLLHAWIFRPLAGLKAGIEAIAARNFHKRLEIVCDNELGRLTAAFNHSLETLQELAVAGVVQESLLPEPHLSLNRVEVVAKINAMTDLGGDYFDMVRLDGERLLIFIGDATGHGIPAALSMAMAKAVLLHESQREISASGLMHQLNQVFCSLRA